MNVDLAPPTFAVVDVETSGLSLRRHHVLQIGVVVVTIDGDIVDRWTSLIRPRRAPWFRVGPSRLHGIHRRHMRHAPAAQPTLDEFSRRIDGHQLVAHNATFDVDFLHKAFRRAKLPAALPTALCTLTLSRMLDPERELRHRLSDLCQRYGVDLATPHNAAADATATALVLPYLLRAHSVVDRAGLAELLVTSQDFARRGRPKPTPVVGLDDGGSRTEP